MSFYDCALYGNGACERCCDLNAFRYKSNMRFRMWQSETYRDSPRVPWGTIVKERAHAVALGQMRASCSEPTRG